MSQFQKQKVTLNNILLDYSDSLWRNRAFKTKEKHTIYKHIDPTTVARNKSTCSSYSFDLSQHPALLPYSRLFLNEVRYQNQEYKFFNNHKTT